MFRRLVVPVDGSTFSERALQYAAPIARASGAELDLVLVHVRQSPASADMLLLTAAGEWEHAQRTREADYLQELGRTVKRDYCVEPRIVLLDGEIVHCIERHIREAAADLVVMTSHGRAGIERAWLGSVSDALLRKLEVPVLLIRPSDTEPAAQSAVPEYRHVLIALDGSERAEKSIAPALALAADDTRVTLLRVTAPPAASASPYMPHTVTMTREQLELRRRAALDYVNGVRDRLRREHPQQFESCVLVDYHAAHAILDYAAVHEVDMIALGAHGRNPVARMLLGSVSDKVVRAATAPVLVS